MLKNYLNKKKFNNKKKKNGFTLVETLVVIVIFSLILIALSNGIFSLFKDYRYNSQQAHAIEEAERGISTMVREIREISQGDDGSYPIEEADDNEIIFYSDIDKDGQVERVRYFLGGTEIKSKTKECVSYLKGGSCSVNFSNFLNGTLESAQLKVSVEGDFGWSREYAEIFVDGEKIGNICKGGCSDCPATWQGLLTFDITDQAADGNINIVADASTQVDPYCNWINPHHSMKLKVELIWTEKNPEDDNKLKKGVIEPTSSPVEYPSDQEKFYILSSYVRNDSPIFEYYDSSGNKIEEYPARLSDTKLIKIHLKIDVDPDRSPQSFDLNSFVQPRNLKDNF